MSRLIHANIVRMIQSKIFWTAEFFLIGYSILVYIGGHDSFTGERAGSAGPIYFFNEMLFIGAVIAIFAVVFVGVEYSDGTIRNKIAVGHARKDIYLSNFIACYAAGILQFITYCVVSAVIVFLFTDGAVLMQMNQLPWRIVYSLFIILVYSAAFSMLAMLDTNGKRAMAVGVLSVLILYILMTQIYGDLQRQIGYVKRAVYEWIDIFLPIDQAMYVIDPEASYTVKMPICFLAETVLFMSAGMYFFRKKDIK